MAGEEIHAQEAGASWRTRFIVFAEKLPPHSP
jgi:hypothetical protein